MEDIYESEEGQLLGIPAGLAMTSHMMNENILISFFPNHQIENLSSGDEDNTNTKSGFPYNQTEDTNGALDFFGMFSKRDNSIKKIDSRLKNENHDN